MEPSLERALIDVLGGPRSFKRTRPRMSLQELDERVLYLQINSVDDSTLKSYAVGAREYMYFCTTYHFPFDPTPITLARFIAFTSISSASDGAKYLAGARHFLRHFYPSIDKNCANPLVTAAIRGAKKIWAEPIRRLKDPLRPFHLDAFHKIALATGSYDDWLFVTMLSCCFYACHRSSELVFKSLDDFDSRKAISRGSLTFPPGKVQYTLPYHKGDPFYRGTAILHIAQDVADPVTLLRHYTTLRDKIYGAKPNLFLHADGSIPLRSWFDAKLRTILGGDFSRHSARAGGATFYAAQGLSENIMQPLGRWSSAAWKKYVRDHPNVRAEQHVGLARTRRRRI